MDRQLINHLRDIVEGIVKEQGFELVELSYRYEGSKLVLVIFADRSGGGITIDECARLNNQISLLLDKKDLIRQSYVLEVSSPGIDRPLKTKADFKRCIKRKVIVYTSEPVMNKIQWEGFIMDADEDLLYLDAEGESLPIPLGKINKAKQIIEEI